MKKIISATHVSIIELIKKRADSATNKKFHSLECKIKSRTFWYQESDRPLSCYAFIIGWLFPSLPLGCHKTPVTFKILI